MADAAVAFLVEQVKEVMKEFKDLIGGAENEFEQLKVELDSMKAFPSKKYEEENQIKDAAHEIEDRITVCLSRAIEAKARSSRWPELFDSKCSGLQAEEVNSITKGIVMQMFEQVKVNFARTPIADAPDNSLEYPTRNKPMTRKNRAVVGWDDEEQSTIGCLLEKGNQLDFIPITAMPRLGKTSLAWKVYESKRIRYHFPIRIWVSVSSKLDSRGVYLQILGKLAPNKDDASELETQDLARTVKALLEKEKFLLVLDDVCSVEDWEEIKEVLPLSNEKGKVLVTGFETLIGRIPSFNGRMRTIRFLNDDESWMMLQYEVFGDLDDCPMELRVVGKRIASRCGGVPLIILMIGGLLVDQLPGSTDMARKRWEMVLEQLTDASVDKVRISDAVALSYEALPVDMRECLVYLGTFPPYHDIPVETLCALWIAEEFIQPEDGRSLEEVAEEILNHLIRRSLLMVERKNRTGQVKTCRVHDEVRDFCLKKSEELSLFLEIKTGMLEHAVEEHIRLCLHSDLSNFLCRNPVGPRVRSLLCYDKQFVEKPEYLSAILDGFQLLRVLEFKSVRLLQFPCKFVKLIHLRYLTLYINSLTVLPEAICQVWNLQSLIVETGSHSITMKANLWRMIQLRHFKTNAPVILDPDWEGEAGHNLQTMYQLSPESCTRVFSRKAKNLKTLGIFGKLDTAFFETIFLAESRNLETLKLVNSLVHDKETSEQALNVYPRWSYFPQTLKRLTLRNTFLSWDRMFELAMIKSLEVLKLKDNAFVGSCWFASTSFPNLQLLLIVNADLSVWMASNDSFASLRYLVVKNCENLDEIPECVGTHLKKLEIDHLRHSAILSAKRIEDTKKMADWRVQFDLQIGPNCEKVVDNLIID